MKTEKKRKTVKTDKTRVAKAKSPENDARSTLVEGFEPSSCLGPSCLLLSAFSLLATGDLLLNCNSFPCIDLSDQLCDHLRLEIWPRQIRGGKERTSKYTTLSLRCKSTF